MQTINPDLIGVHENMPASDYHTLPGASASQLRVLFNSTPAHLKASLDTPVEITPAMILGTLAHSVILEPDKPLPGLAIQPATYFNGKDGSEKPWNNNASACKEWVLNCESKGFVVLKAQEYESVFGMAQTIASHVIASESLKNGRSELSLVAEDSANNIIVRSRLDFVPDGKDYLSDVKTTVSASALDFERKAYDAGYHIQAALYLDLWNSLTGDNRTTFRFIVVEQKPPYAVNVFQCSKEFLSRGSDDYKRTLALYAKCLLSDQWPAYPVVLNDLKLPKWA